MKKIFAILFIVIGLQGFSQALPYLNASRGNANECVVDKDTNIYLFHFNQIEKYNKHLQSIWVKRYDSLIISNLLLSKTNALFFIANKNSVGKMDTAGNIIWCKKTNLTFVNMLLNHSNQLMLSHNNGLFKIDTVGNVVYYKEFNYTNPAYLLNDSMGVYELIVSKLAGMSNMELCKFKYSETLDSIVAIKIRGLNNTCIDLYNMFTSSFFSNIYYVYYRTYSCSGPGMSFGYLEKHKNNTIIYSIPYNVVSGPPNKFNNITEDKYGNVYYSQSRRVDESAPVYSGGYHNDIYKIDSLGQTCRIKQLIDEVWTSPPAYNIPHEKGTFHYLYDNHFVFDYVGRGYGLSNLVIKDIDSTISTVCSSSSTYTFVGVSGAFLPVTNNYIFKSNNTTYSITTQTVNVSIVSNFTPDFNYCLTIGLNELRDNNLNILMYPNPATNVLNIEFSPAPDSYRDELTEQPTTIEIKNALGQVLETFNITAKTTQISLSHFTTGLYFINLKIGRKTVMQKLMIQK